MMAAKVAQGAGSVCVYFAIHGTRDRPEEGRDMVVLIISGDSQPVSPVEDQCEGASW